MLFWLICKSLAYSSPSLAFCAASDWAATDTPGTVCDWRKEVTREAFAATTLGPPLLIIGLLGGMGGGTRAELAAPNWPFLTGGCGGWPPWCCTLWARMIVATLDPAVMALELSCLKTCPGDIERAMPVAKNQRKLVTSRDFHRIVLTWTRYWNAWNCRRGLNDLGHAAHARPEGWLL